MAKIIKHGAIVDDSWQVLRLAEGESVEQVSLPAGKLIVPLTLWQARREALKPRAAQRELGVWLASHESAESIATDLGAFTVIALDFPKFIDGRAYSNAVLLRRRFGWSGELRAIGDVLRDQMFYQSRVGFDAFAVREDKDIEVALSAFQDFSEKYQASVDEPLPLFRRRLA